MIEIVIDGMGTVCGYLGTIWCVANLLWGLFRNDGGTVTAVVSREQFQSLQSEQFVEEAFHGSLPAFLAAFISRKKLSEEELQLLQRLIDKSREG